MVCQSDNLKILIADDSARHIEKYATYFKKYFTKVFTAKDGAEAYEIYQEKLPEVILLDINMPKLNGIDLLKKIRETDNKTQVIILSAHSEKKYLLETSHFKITDYLVKPVTREQLKKAIDTALSTLKSQKDKS